MNYGENVKRRMMKTKKQTNNTWIPVSQALQLCEDQGLSVTSPGLVYAGKQRKFIRKSLDGFHWEFQKEGLLEYITEAVKEAPPGWITIREAAEIMGVSIGTVYNRINSGEIKAKQFGRNRLYYVDESILQGVNHEKK